MTITLNRPLTEIIKDPLTYFNGANRILNTLQEEGIETQFQRNDLIFTSLALNIVRALSDFIDFSKNPDSVPIVVEVCKTYIRKTIQSTGFADFQRDEPDYTEAYNPRRLETGLDAVIRAGGIVAHLEYLYNTLGEKAFVRIQNQPEQLKRRKNGSRYWVPCDFCVRASSVAGIMRVSDLIKEYSQTEGYIPFKKATNFRLLPFHPNCRCTYVSIDPAFIPKTALAPPKTQPLSVSDLENINNPEIFKQISKILPVILTATSAAIIVSTILLSKDLEARSQLFSELFNLKPNESVLDFLESQEGPPQYKESVSRLNEEQANIVKDIIQAVVTQKPTIARAPKQPPSIPQKSSIQSKAEQIQEEVISRIKDATSPEKLESVLLDGTKEPLALPSKKPISLAPEASETVPIQTQGTLTERVNYEILENQSPDLLSGKAELEARGGRSEVIFDEPPQAVRTPSSTLNQQLSLLNQEIGRLMEDQKGDSSFYFESIYRLLRPIGEIQYDNKLFDLSKKSDLFDLLRLSASKRKISRSKKDQFEIIIEESLKSLGVPKKLTQSIVAKIKILKDRNKDTRAYRAYTKAESNAISIHSLNDPVKTREAVRNLELIRKKFLKTLSIEDETRVVQNIVQELGSWKNIDAIVERAKTYYFPPNVAYELDSFYNSIRKGLDPSKGRYPVSLERLNEIREILRKDNVIETFYNYNNILVLIASIKPEIYGLADVTLNPILLEARIQASIKDIMPDFGKTPPKQKLIEYVKVIDKHSKYISQYLAILQEYQKYVSSS